jgi:AraC-like DNA-binding protein
VAVLAGQAGNGEHLAAYLRERGFEVNLCRVDQDLDWLRPLLASPPGALILEQSTARHGWAILEMLKRQPALERIPVLAFSLDPERDRGEWLELNHRFKPLLPDQLAVELERLGTIAAPRTALVVDDDPGTLDLHCRLVEQTGCRTIRARDGREALLLLDQTRPDLILLDLMMPEVDGFTVLEAVRERESTRDVPVIILTARVLDEENVERLNRGVAAILSKGLFSSTETLQRIEAALTRHNTLGGATQRLVRRAMGFIHAHYAQPLTREQIAGRVGISPDYLTDCFRQELGVTPIAYLNRYRIRQARDLLEKTDLKVTQVALAVGFSESAHFTRTFQREVGLTPRAYRRRKRA